MFSLTYPPQSVSELVDDARRLVLGTAYALRPHRVAALPHVAAAVMRGAVSRRPDFPDFLAADAAQREFAGGFIGLCGALTPEELMAGFRRGYFPTSHIGRKKWWRLESRMVMAPHEMVREKDVRRLLRNKRLTVTFDTAFADVMRACGAPRPGQVPLTWITPDIIDAYGRLHAQGHAHSFEAWDNEGNLVGGGFGIAVGSVFVIESQFTGKRNASKVAMATLLRHLSDWGFALADGKAHTPHLERLGFRPTPHEDYLDTLQFGPHNTAPVGVWSVDDTLDASKDWAPPAPSSSLEVQNTSDALRGAA